MADIGLFYASTGIITGSLSAQNLLSLQNPSASGVRIGVKNIRIHGIVTALSTGVFSYSFSRTSGAPSGGSTLSSVKKFTSSAAATGVARSSPTATATGGAVKTSLPGALLTAVGVFTPVVHMLYESDSDENDIVLDENESLVVQAGANLLTWSHVVDIEWRENTK